MADAGLEGFLSSTRRGGRNIEYAVSGSERGEPVLLFYPMGACRRLAALFDLPAKRAKAQLVCINRPGMARTSRAPPGRHLEVACTDIVAVLDHLGIERAGVLFMCAGAPFGLTFCARFPERVSGRTVGCSTWVSPRDCPEARLLFKLGASMPSRMLASLAGAMATCLRSVPASPFNSLSSISDVSGECLSDEEAAFFCADQSGECKARVARLLEPMQGETGGEGDDAAVLVDGAGAWGFAYGALRHPVALFHGEEDATVPMACAEWLRDQLPGASVLYRVPHGTHADVMLFGIRAALGAVLSDDWQRGGSKGRSRTFRASGQRSASGRARTATSRDHRQSE